jgi:UDP-2-acetamido-2,6-beta-L-arabino-hexul-4-ose reductase
VANASAPRTEAVKILITGAEGFIARNLRLRLAEEGGFEVVPFSRGTPAEALPELLQGVGAVVHLAGVNRPQDPAEFETGNAGLTRHLCEALAAHEPNAAVLVSSSTQAERANPYGASKRAAEEAVLTHGRTTGAPVYVWRLPNVFGKWSRPNYNSAVATFCHNIARGLPITVNDPAAALNLVYIDDVIETWLPLLQSLARGERPAFSEVRPVYSTTVGDLATQIQAFRDSRQTLVTERVGTGFVRALYSTYVSFLPTEAFAYGVPMHGDPRGVFVEMLKTPDSGQFSFFTAGPGITRGGHYHHSKTEKFLVIRGQARFRFRHMLTGEQYELFTGGQKAEIVETVPGWTHDITNVGDEEMIVMLWANEIFDRQRPDTIAAELWK